MIRPAEAALNFAYLFDIDIVLPNFLRISLTCRS